MPTPFARVADRYGYGEGVLGARVRRAMLAAIEARLARGASILDVGAGTGDYAIPLARAGYDVTALDVEPEMLAQVERRAAEAGVRVRTMLHDVRAPLDGDFDAALSVSGPLNYFADPTPSVANVARALEPGAPVWFGLSRGAFVPYALRHPRYVLRSCLTGRAVVRGTLAGEAVEVHLWDPRAFARAIAPWFATQSIRALVLAPRLPERVDLALGRRRGLRRLGAISLLEGHRT